MMHRIVCKECRKYTKIYELLNGWEMHCDCLNYNIESRWFWLLMVKILIRRMKDLYREII